jgi:4-diphosphocytidyl-2-C-methyl-D-erythritol kinase
MTPRAAVRVRAPAKINLHLAVGDVRPDGYHDLVTVFHAVDLADELLISVADRHSVHTIPPDGVPVGGRNLAGIAARLLARRSSAGGPVAIEITKQIPVAGGMAGGSADAAATLVGCAALWGLDMGRADLAQIAAEIGADVPFALTGGTAVGTGARPHAAALGVGARRGRPVHARRLRRVGPDAGGGRTAAGRSGHRHAGRPRQW